MMKRRDAIGGLLMALATEGGAAGAGSETGMWPNRIFTLQGGQTTHEAFGDVTVYHDGKTAQLSSMVSGSVLLHPGQEPHPPHQHPEEEFMLVTEGTGEILVAGKTHPVKPGDLMYCEGNALHGVKNTGTVPFRFFYAKWLSAKT